MSADVSWFERQFKVRASGSTIGTEIRGGLTNYLVMSYILVVNAVVLGNAGIPFPAVVAATALMAALFTAGMAVADSCEGLLMLRLYDWALADRDRSLRLNTATTLIPAVLALSVAACQWAALARATDGPPPAIYPYAHSSAASAIDPPLRGTRSSRSTTNARPARMTMFPPEMAMT